MDAAPTGSDLATLRGIVEELAELPPLEDFGSTCYYCNAWCMYGQTLVHEPTCLWLRSQQFKRTGGDNE
jgi:hypothetical protein